MKGLNTYRLWISGSSLILAVALACTKGFYWDSLDRSSIQEDFVLPPVSKEETEALEAKAAKEVEGPREEAVTLDEGDTLMAVITRMGISPQEAHNAIDAMSKIFNPRGLKSGQEISLIYEPLSEEAGSGSATNTLLEIFIRPQIEFEIEVKKDKSGKFHAQKIKKELAHETKYISGVIQGSLYSDATKKGAPSKILHDMIRAFSYDVDFQRDFHPGDTFELIYDQYADKDDNLERPGEILYGALNLGGEDYRIYRFQPPNGLPDYYKGNGESVRKALLRTPVDGARLSSPFGARKHPILGYSKMHKGVDFAAPRGTPVMAAGDGVVQKASFWNSYGNYILVQHSGGFATAYAHLNGYAKGIKPGKQVRQGQVIGFIGTTGRSTGPHLHYEVLKGGQHINPQSIKQLPGGKLGGKALVKFKAYKAQLDSQAGNHQKIENN